MNLSDLVFEKYDGMDVSIYATSEVIDEFICDNEIKIEDVEDLCLLDDEDFVTLSRCCFENGEEEWFLEELIHEDGRQFINETEVLIVEENIAEIVDFRKISFEILEMLETDEDEIEEDNRDWLDDVANEILYSLAELEDGECPHCVIKEHLKAVKGATLDEVIDEIGNLYRRIN